MPDVNYRLATEADFPPVAEMYSKLDALMHRMGMHLPSPENVGQTWVDSFRRTLGRYSFLHILEIDSAIMGLLLSRIKRLPPYWGGVLVGELTDIWVHSSVRRLNHAEKLVHHAIRQLKDHDVHSVEVRILFENVPAQALIESVGFITEVHTARLLWENYDKEEDE